MTPCNRVLNSRESRKTPKSSFRECECHPQTPSKWGYDNLDIPRIKTLEKVIVDEIKTCKREEKENKMSQTNSRIGFHNITSSSKTIGKHAKTQFVVAWTIIVIVKMGNHFHHNFQANFQIDSCKYMGVNLRCTTWAQQ